MSGGPRKMNLRAEAPTTTNLRVPQVASSRRDVANSRLRSEDTLSVQNTSGVPSFTPSATNAGTLPAGAGYALLSPPQQAVAPVAYVPQPAPQQNNMMPMIASMAGQALQMMGGGGSGSSKQSGNGQMIRGRGDAGTNSYASDNGGAFSGPTEGATPPSCVSCSKPTSQDPRFQSCSNSNGYYEDILERASDPGLALLKSHTPAQSTMTCIARGMQTVSTQYRYCADATSRYGQKVDRPCASERMVRAVSSAYELTSECLAAYIDPRAESSAEAKASIRRAAFQLMNHESSWSLNAVSQTGAGGMGQMVQGAIQDVNRNEWSAIMNQVRGSSNPSCQTLAKMSYIPMSGSLSASCERISPKNGNPQLNMMYTFGHMKLVRERVEGMIDALNLPSSVRTQLIDQITVWGHNVGSGGIAEALRISLRRHGQTLQSGNVQGFLKEMQGDVYQWHVAKTSRDPREPTRFLAKTQQDLARVEAGAGGNCGVFNNNTASTAPRMALGQVETQRAVAGQATIGVN